VTEIEKLLLHMEIKLNLPKGTIMKNTENQVLQDDRIIEKFQKSALENS
jgi:hypothetical protein